MGGEGGAAAEPGRHAATDVAKTQKRVQIFDGPPDQAVMPAANTAPGDVKGQNVKGVWFAVTPTGGKTPPFPVG
jgi:hypothetical protein